MYTLCDSLATLKVRQFLSLHPPAFFNDYGL